jgi:Zn-dependent peptidase ImmA (M78 family)
VKVAYKHRVVMPSVDRVLHDAACVDATLLRFPRPVDEIIVFCYPLAIQELAGLDTKRARAEISKLGGASGDPPDHNHKLAGYLFVRDDAGVILVEGHDSSEGRKRFTKAHELGHFVLQALEKREERTATPDLFARPQATRRFFRTECTPEDLTRSAPTPREDWLAEARANYFAAELLMPVDEIGKQLRRFGETRAQPPARELIAALSRHFGVSRAAMEVRLTDLQAVRVGDTQGYLC